MEIGEGIGIPELPDLAVSGPASVPVQVHAGLRLRSVTFSGNHPVEEDTLGTFAAPEWVRGRGRQWPVCFSRNTPVRLTARFEVSRQPSSAEDVQVRGTLSLGAVTLEWTGTVHCKPSDAEVSTSELTSSRSLPDEVGCFELARVVFMASAPTLPFTAAGASLNTLYVTLGAPSGTPAYWTLLDISCRAAAGATTEEALTAKAALPFGTRKLTRQRDGKGLTYWNPTTTDATTTQELLARPDGSGQCGSWSEFLVDMHKVHGITTSEKVLVVRNLSDWKASKVGFLVKHWTFVGKGSLPPPFTHELYVECVMGVPLPGQRSPDPPPAFFNHFIVRVRKSYYDPSYGGGPVSDQRLWEAGAIDGLFTGQAAGYPKDPRVLLLEFYGLTTGAKL